MKRPRRLWIVPAVLSLPFWACWFVFALAMHEGAAEALEKHAWRTIYFLGAMALTMSAALLCPPQLGPPKE